MLNEQINLDPQLVGLIKAGYNAEIIDSLLIIREIPYLTADNRVDFGSLACNLNKSGDSYTAADHTFYFCGEKPYASPGVPHNFFANEADSFNIPNIGIARFHLSSKPSGGNYTNLLEKVERYTELLSNPAIFVDPCVTPKAFKLTTSMADDSPFVYEDSASVRAGISNLSSIFHGMKIGIIGLGGTGSYILDLVAKTPVEEIHLYDYDMFSQHNAFRTPGAAAKENVNSNITKLDYLKNTYDKMHKGIINHHQKIDSSSSDDLFGLSFVFLAIDSGKSRKEISDLLIELEIPFIDVGIGLDVPTEGFSGLSGMCRVSFSTKETVDLFRRTTPFSGGDDDLYNTNIQVADINALNATLAVIKWKKYLGYYQDINRESLSVYTVDTNGIARHPE